MKKNCEKHSFYGNWNIEKIQNKAFSRTKKGVSTRLKKTPCIATCDRQRRRAWTKCFFFHVRPIYTYSAANYRGVHDGFRKPKIACVVTRVLISPV